MSRTGPHSFLRSAYLLYRLAGEAGDAVAALGLARHLPGRRRAVATLGPAVLALVAVALARDEREVRAASAP